MQALEAFDKIADAKRVSMSVFEDSVFTPRRRTGGMRRDHTAPKFSIIQFLRRADVGIAENARVRSRAPTITSATASGEVKSVGIAARLQNIPAGIVGQRAGGNTIDLTTTTDRPKRTMAVAGSTVVADTAGAHLPQVAARRVTPAEAEACLLPAVRQLIGENGVERLKAFASLKPGWDKGKGSRLNPISLQLFNGFFGHGELKPAGVSVFFSSEGNLIGNWLDEDGQVTELEFSPQGILYFIESSAEESVVRYGIAGDFKRRLVRDDS
jgi:hypothetical protein